MSPTETDPAAGARAFFGRRKGHKLRARQAGLIETLLPRLAVDTSISAPSDLGTLFPVPVEDIRVEIGFGSGEHMIAEARAYPRTGFIGCEAFMNGMAKALTAIDELGLQNIRLYFDDAAGMIEWLPTGVIARVDLIYPDPWPKRRHWKRRFIQDASLARIARILRPGGELRFVTDIPDYAGWMLARAWRSPDFVWTAECADDWRNPWPGFTGTRYEAKAVRERRVPCYLIFQRV